MKPMALNQPPVAAGLACKHLADLASNVFCQGGSLDYHDPHLFLG